MWPGDLQLKLYFLHKFTVFPLASLSQTDTLLPNGFEFIHRVCLGTSPFILSLMWLLTPGSLLALFCLWSFIINCMFVFFLFHADFFLANLLALTAWKGKDKFQPLDLNPWHWPQFSPINSPKPIEMALITIYKLHQYFMIIGAKHRQLELRSPLLCSVLLETPATKNLAFLGNWKWFYLPLYVPYICNGKKNPWMAHSPLEFSWDLVRFKCFLYGLLDSRAAGFVPVNSSFF